MLKRYIPKDDPRKKRIHYLLSVNAEIRRVGKTKRKLFHEEQIRQKIEKQRVREEKSKYAFNHRFEELLQVTHDCSQLPSFSPLTDKKFCIKKVHTYDEFSYIQRVGCIIRYPSDSEPRTYHYVLNRSNLNYLSDFGGGIRRNESWIDGFSRECVEECPWMKEDILGLIHNTSITQLFLEITKGHTCKLLFLITLPQMPTFLSRFYPTEEVKELLLLSSAQILRAFTFTSGLNYGILSLKRIYRASLLEEL